MKKILLSIFILSIIDISYSQGNAHGQIVWKNDSFSNATFIIPYDNEINDYSLQLVEAGIKYYNTNPNDLKVLKPKDVKEIRFILKNDSIRMASCPDILDSKNDDAFIFLRVLVDGKVRLLSYYIKKNYSVGDRSMSVSTYKLVPKPILQNKEGVLTKINEFNFKKQTKHYFTECKEITKKIVLEVDGYSYANLLSIVKEYNQRMK